MTRKANGPSGGSSAGQPLELDLHRSPGVRPQPLERRRLGADHVVDEQHEPLHHRAFRERFHGVEHAQL